jgi:tRNA-dihydrouridine synthase B
MITIHGRTRCQFYKGHANWAAIRAVKDAVTHPRHRQRRHHRHRHRPRGPAPKSGADGVMIGRGAQGAPWRLAQVAHDIYGTPAPKIPEGGRLAG